METLNLSDTGEGMVPIKYQAPRPTPPQAPPPQAPHPPQALQYVPQVPEKNIPKQQMDSTPIDDVLGPADLQQPMLAPPQQAFAAAPMQAAPSAPSKAVAAQKSKNPLGLNDEQYQALIAGVAAILAFSNPVQEKLLSAVPQFMAEGGGRSTSGLVATGLIAAIIFYFAQRFLMKA